MRKYFLSAVILMSLSACEDNEEKARKAELLAKVLEPSPLSAAQKARMAENPTPPPPKSPPPPPPPPPPIVLSCTMDQNDPSKILSCKKADPPVAQKINDCSSPSDLPPITRWKAGMWGGL